MPGADQQDADLDRLVAEVTEQQERLQLVRFDNDDAWALGCRLVELGRERDLPITVDIRRHGHQLFHASRPGTTPDNDTWVERKTRVVDRFGAPSFLLGLKARRAGRTFEEQTGLPVQEYAAHGGSFPLTVRDVGIVGTVTVSGLPQAEDHALVVEALEELCGEQARTTR
ncbi:heme-degrading domain-containing protein [Actinotalea ferrariae]|uniref:heme-degrading domain-containing protein n=1 Tax=Actinotalea ferrariae TaxID=1386098 RepID=UPI001C8BF242|nr:heme-degrading domain-containing protein [Actinotalea ferrariae]MBX9245074.1 heme-degrading domain-containing protein [Actinotalea ferrariae]